MWKVLISDVSFVISADQFGSFGKNPPQNHEFDLNKEFRIVNLEVHEEERNGAGT